MGELSNFWGLIIFGVLSFSFGFFWFMGWDRTFWSPILFFVFCCLFFIFFCERLYLWSSDNKDFESLEWKGGGVR